MEKAVDVEAKASLQPFSGIKEIDSSCPKGYRPTKKDKDEANREHRDGDKTKSTHNPSPANTSQPQAQASKKNKCHQGSRRDHLTTEVNITEVPKKDKDKAKDLSHIECYTCKQKGHYANKCPEKPKN